MNQNNNDNPIERVNFINNEQIDEDKVLQSIKHI